MLYIAAYGLSLMMLACLALLVCLLARVASFLDSIRCPRPFPGPQLHLRSCQGPCDWCTHMFRMNQPTPPRHLHPYRGDV